MKKQSTKILVAVTLPLIGLFALPQLGAEPTRPTDSDQTETSFMFRKLEAVNQINTGLATEDFQLIKTGGTKLLELSEDAAWKVRRDPLYLHYSSAFQTNVNGLIKAAEQESLGDATFSYINITVSCMSCHKHVRGVVQVSSAGLE